MQHNFTMVLFREAENTLVPERRQAPGDRFKGHPEIIRNIPTRHRKRHHVRMLQTVVHFQQKGGNFLQRILAAQQKEMVFRVLKSSGDQMADIVRGTDVAFGEACKKGPALCDPDRRVDDCLGRKSMNFTVLDTEDITRQMKRADLTATIRKAFVRPNCAPAYLVNVVRWFCFSKKFRAAANFKLAPKSILAS